MSCTKTTDQVSKEVTIICANETTKFGYARLLLLEQESISHNRLDYKVRYHLVFQTEGDRSDGMVK